MKRLTGILILALLIALPLMAIDTQKADVDAVKKVVTESYFNGAFNKLDTEAMKKGFHEDFAIFYANGEKLGRYEIESWISGTEKRKSSPDFDASKSKMTCKIVNCDVTGGAASVKAEMYRDDKHIYTDYLSLLKFSSGWKIAAKVYHEHK